MLQKNMHFPVEILQPALCNVNVLFFFSCVRFLSFFKYIMILFSLLSLYGSVKNENVIYYPIICLHFTDPETCFYTGCTVRSGLLCEQYGSLLARNGTVCFRGVVARFRVCNLIQLGRLESIYQFAGDKSHLCMKIEFFGVSCI